MTRWHVGVVAAVGLLAGAEGASAQVVGAGPGPDLRAIYNPGPTYNPSVGRFSTLAQPYSPYVSGYAGYANAVAGNAFNLYGPVTPQAVTPPTVGGFNPFTGRVDAGYNPAGGVVGGYNPFSNPLGSAGGPANPFTGGTGFNQFPLPPSRRVQP